PFLGTPCQFLVVVGNPKHPALRVGISELVSDGTSLFGTLPPMFRVVNRNLGHPTPGVAQGKCHTIQASELGHYAVRASLPRKRDGALMRAAGQRATAAR